MHRLTAVLVTAVLLLAACTSSDDGSATDERSAAPASPTITVPDAYTSVVVQVLGDPTFPFRGTDGKYHVAYDLELTNTSAVVPATIEKVEVVHGDDPTDVIATIDGDEFVDPDCEFGDCNRLRNLFAQPAEDAVIPPQEGRVLFVDYAFDSADDVPDIVLHHLFARAASGPPAQEPTPVDYLTTPYGIDAGEPIVVGPPVTGKGWVALNGCCQPGFPHRSSPAPFNGEIINGQRFAIDWKRINDAGAFYEGDRDSNDSYIDYGADILAIADGTVVATLDGQAANKPGVLPANDPVLSKELTVENVDGNHIVLDLGDGNYAFYAHLKADTLLVEEGDEVTRGQKIAELGNTGNANASHLHLHIMDGPSVLGSNGLPYVIDEFDYDGVVDPQEIVEADEYLSGNFGKGRLSDPEPRQDELPLLLDIINFPEQP